MKLVAAVTAVLGSVLLAVAFARTLPVVADKEREGRENELNAVCEPALRPEHTGGALGMLPAAPPHFTLKDWNGHDVSIEGARGRVTLLNFWATWCPTCVVEMPSLEKLAEQEASRPFSVLAVSVDEKWEDVYRFFQGRRTQMTVLLDKDKTVPPQYGTDKFPETFILDKEGKVRFYVVSDRDWASPDIKACLDKLIDE